MAFRPLRFMFLALSSDGLVLLRVFESRLLASLISWLTRDSSSSFSLLVNKH